MARTSSQKPSNDDTLTSLNQVSNKKLAELSLLPLPEVEQLKEEVATILPAGNLPGLILMGLTNVRSRKVSKQKRDEDIATLFQGSTLINEGLFNILVSGPAVVLASYQKLLELAGKDSEAAFPEGTWQFYLQFALREDPGRHTNETNGYHKERPDDATMADDIASWVMTAAHQLFDTYALTATLWQEWTTLRVINEAAERHNLNKQNPFRSMVRDWTAARPYVVEAGQSYAARRLEAFERFSATFYDALPLSELGSIGDSVQKEAMEKQPAYQRQMNLLARLAPGRYQDDRDQITLWQAKIALIWEGRIYLIDAVAKDDKGRPYAFTEKGDRWGLAFTKQGQPVDRRGKPLSAQGGWLLRKDKDSVQATPVAYLAPPNPATLKGIIRDILNGKRRPDISDVPDQIVQSPRAEQPRLRQLLPKETQAEIEQLRYAPIIINWDEQDRSLPLGEIRRGAKRGVGDHALTILRTDKTVVFDQSHIFFDGIWGMAIAEVMTNQAISWSNHFAKLKPEKKVNAPEPLVLKDSKPFREEVEKLRGSPQYAFYEVDAETSSVDMRLVSQARKYLKKRGIRLTINDMLVLARVLHAMRYEPAPFVMSQVDKLPDGLKTEVRKSLEASGGYNPALLIPMDAGFVDPKERVFPTTFRNAISGILDAYENATESLEKHHRNPSDATWSKLDEARRAYFAYLNSFGEQLGMYKDIAMRGESINTAILRLLGNLPTAVQHTLDQIPQKFQPLNEVLKGEEVFSNVGRVAEGSSLTRFISAKDDGKAKRFVWGILTDDTGRMTVTLRDFRPHVGPLIRAGHNKLAQNLANDYVLTFVAEMNQLSLHLTDLALAEDEMRWS